MYAADVDQGQIREVMTAPGSACLDRDLTKRVDVWSRIIWETKHQGLLLFSATESKFAQWLSNPYAPSLTRHKVNCMASWSLLPGIDNPQRNTVSIDLLFKRLFSIAALCWSAHVIKALKTDIAAIIHLGTWQTKFISLPQYRCFVGESLNPIRLFTGQVTLSLELLDCLH